MRRWIVVAAVLVGLVGCSNPFGSQTESGSWITGEKVDPISHERTLTATKQLVSDQDPNLVVDAEWSCPKAVNARPYSLQLKLTAYDKTKPVGDGIQGADVDAGTVEYRLDGYGAGIVGKEGGEKFSNEIPLSYLSMVASAEKIGMRLFLPIISNPDAFDPKIWSEADQKMRSATKNYLWDSRELAVRFRAATGVGANDHAFTLPLQDSAVISVARACGWSTGPQPTNSASATGVAREIKGSEASSNEQASVDGGNTHQTVTPVQDGRPARCDIALGFGIGDNYTGPCLFSPTEARDGSFIVEQADGAPILENALAIRLDVISPGKAKVTVSNASGAGNWQAGGTWIREGACWMNQPEGEEVEDQDFSICVR